MRPAILILLLLPAMAFAGSGMPPIPPPAELGVQVEKPAGDGVHYSQGSGVYLGGDLVLTAAHVIKIDPGNRKVTVLIDGWRRDGVIVTENDDGKVDLALVQLQPEAVSDKRRAQRPVPICAANPTPKQPVVVAEQGNVSKSVTIPSPITTDLQTGTWTNLLSTGYHHGSSGGGVFDPQEGCLWGILNMEFSGPSTTTGRFLDLTSFVPASKITPFLNDYYQHATDQPKRSN